MNTYEVMFVEVAFACNRNKLVTTPGEMRFYFRIQAKDIADAYHEAIDRVRKKTKELVQLNFCRLVGSNEP